MLSVQQNDITQDFDKQNEKLAVRADNFDCQNHASGFVMLETHYTSLMFDWGANDSFAKILELGLSADVFFRNIPIVIGEVRPPVYLNLFMNFYFGKRW